MELRPPVAFLAVAGQEFNWERPWVGVVLYQALPFLQFFTHNIRAAKSKGRERESLGIRLQ